MAGPKKARDNNSQKTITGQQVHQNDGQRHSPVSSGNSSAPKSIPAYDGPAEGRDPAKNQLKLDERALKRLDMGVSGWTTAVGGVVPDGVPRRPTKPNGMGTEVAVALNTFPVLKFNTKTVYQYAVQVGSGAEKRAVIRKAFECPSVQKALGQGSSFIFDGNCLAWSLKQLPRNINMEIDLDVEAGKQPRKKRNVFRIVIEFTNKVRFDTLEQYMAGKCAFDSSILEAISFLDHLMRQTPSKMYTSIKRNFFSKNGDAPRMMLSSAIEATKGVYASIRIANGGYGRPGQLTVNVDVANSAFFKAQSLQQAVVSFTRARDLNDFKANFERSRKKSMNAFAEIDLWKKSVYYLNLQRLKRVGIEVRVGNQPARKFILHDFLVHDSAEFKFETTVKGPDGKPQLDKNGNAAKETISLRQYYQKKYNYRPELGLPVIKTTKGEVFPMELCHIPVNERYPFKLDPNETSNMIKFAVTLPSKRLQDIKSGLGMLGWDKDPILKEYGLQLSMDRAIAKGRLLPPPDVNFAGNTKEPGASAARNGRWRIDGKKFQAGNSSPLRSWGVCLITGTHGAASKEGVSAFFQQFVKVYKGHGGSFQNDRPEFVEARVTDGGQIIERTFNTVGNKFQQKPQILFFILPNKDSDMYHRIKKSCECRFGIVSQCMQAAHVMKNQAQYISNICMKVNAKLGGFTSHAKGNVLGKSLDPMHFKIPTAVMGADVSHAAPGVKAGSTAAITMSLNHTLTRYGAVCETNGFRVEMVSQQNIEQCMGKLLSAWAKNLNSGKLPERLFYFRDGVSEGQYAQVLEDEVRHMKALCKRIDPRTNVKFIVVIASKRHHIRFFPQTNADRNGNPMPGTLVETHCTHPFEFDFYLCAHTAIKGTARPIHYHVLLNEPNMDPQALQQMIYEHSFQYIRATTPVSLFPAVYYAHLASTRSKAHENKPAASGGKKDAAQMKKESDSVSGSTAIDLKPLLPLLGGLEYQMWYI